MKAMKEEGRDPENASALTLAEAHLLLREMIASFDSEANRKRLSEVILASQENSNDIILKAMPVAIEIASTAMIRFGIRPGLDSFIELMTRLSEIADEELARSLYILKCKFLPYPPSNHSSSQVSDECTSNSAKKTHSSSISSSITSTSSSRGGKKGQLPPLQNARRRPLNSNDHLRSKKKQSR